MDYHIVTQNGVGSGCLFGIRQHIIYVSKKAFQGTRKLDSSITVGLAEGITNEEAENLVALTPEICRYMETIEEYFKQHEFPSATLLQMALDNTRATTIEESRRSIQYSGLKRANAKPFNEHFTKIASENSQSVKSYAILWALSTVTNQRTGQVR